MKLHSLFPNFHIHVSVSDLYIPRIRPSFFLQQKRQTDRGNIYVDCSEISECRNWGLAVLFLGIFVLNFRYSVFTVYVLRYDCLHGLTIVLLCTQRKLALLSHIHPSCPPVPSFLQLILRQSPILIFRSLFWDGLPLPRTLPLAGACNVCAFAVFFRWQF